MGYTTSWDFNPTHPAVREGWGRFVLDAKTIIDACAELDPPVILCGPLGDPTTRPELSEGHIAFNGPRWGWREGRDLNDNPSALDAASDVVALAPDGYVADEPSEACEPFSISLDPNHNRRWTKTNRHRYDLAVKAIVLRGHAILGDALVPSVWDLDSWISDWIGAPTSCDVSMSATQLVAELFGSYVSPPFQE